MDKQNGMTYLEKIANGNAGEFYFAYWVSNKFVWPCRILDIDMGLDAQVEIYDDENNSTGMFIGVQVKTTAKTLAETPSVSVPIKNVVYWESISDPIILVRVCFNNGNEPPCLYWQHLNKEELTSHINNGADSVSFRFTEENILSEEDKIEWIKLFLKPNDLEFIEQIENINNNLINYAEMFKNNFPNGWDSFSPGDELNDLLNKHDEFQHIININPRILFLSDEAKELQENYDEYIYLIKSKLKMLIDDYILSSNDFRSSVPLNPFIQSCFRYSI
ncbi:DUF4365 domain-containing protein [Providencia stuartii]|uniref:DUF4365 domain-containing protein n=1 Tax=Providencia stuartii (strain MRSN 2154) TaxID=1157951 RepID=A0A140NDW5_PROSM|nr:MULTISPECIES: DUF4365 domain-containing protein [Providencia]AFH91924.1 hypothetical protein S70_00095 [Providencia stuartii MRSN 2154]MDE8744690.1 DUF4365 domain-containing protein [Providencia thailandensis]MDE8765910.1 DUF4365 domain-containing protein [Providencia thailandensis]MDE8778356.1 DUF4365 domain-containing protein [Providencia thailandensis]MDE8782612.1 DUF4365 domain-containing protein [Providencia thailandensis]